MQLRLFLPLSLIPSKEIIYVSFTRPSEFHRVTRNLVRVTTVAVIAVVGLRCPSQVFLWVDYPRCPRTHGAERAALLVPGE